MSIKAKIGLSSFLISCGASFLSAQTADTPIFEQNRVAIMETQRPTLKKALELRGEVGAISREEIGRQLLAPKPEPVQLAPVRTKTMSGEAVAEHARKSSLRVGYCYQRKEGGNWNIKFVGGYAIAPDVIVTNDHVVATKTEMEDGFLIAVDHTGAVACAVAVLARNPEMDAALIKVAGAEFTPVPLNPEVKQGSASYIFSYPLGQQGYFSAGVINRFYWDKGYKGADKDRDSIDALCHLRVNYSNEWAPGSSGSPLFDVAGNVTGHVSTIFTPRGGRKGGATLLLMHMGIPARSVQKLAETLTNPEEILRLANSGEAPSEDPGDEYQDEDPSEENVREIKKTIRF